MTKRIEELRAKKEELEIQLADPSVARDQSKLSKIGKELQSISDILDLHETVSALEKEIHELEEMQNGDESELAAMAETEIPEKRSALEKKQEELEQAITPKDPKDARDVIVEIRAGAGGDEAGLFAAEMQRAYLRFAEAQQWKVHIVSTSRTGIGGYKEVIFEIHGTDVYGTMKFESGVHRVQRVPETEKSGRVHTSTITVAVLPIVEEKDIQIKPEDVKIDITTATGHGGQSVNTTYSAVRMIHIPTGIMVYCQDERSQKQNKLKAMEILRARVYALEEEKRMKAESQQRKGQIGTGDRSEKIRTYNFPQDRVTDHRIKESIHNIGGFMEGGMSELIKKLQKAQYAKQ